jgi:C_GCAxxG_C_C family probable redox protein
MSAKATASVGIFLKGYNCAQAVLWSFHDELRLDPDAALKVACGFGAGMGRQQQTCGALAGGIMVLGLKYGRGGNQDRVATEVTYSKVRDLMQRFEAKHGSCLCRTLLQGCDLSTEEGQRFFKENDLLNKTCKRCVETVVQALEEIG